MESIFQAKPSERSMVVCYYNHDTDCFGDHDEKQFTKVAMPLRF